MYASILADILSVIADHWPLITGLLLAILFGQLLIGAALQALLGDRATAGEYYSLSVAGGAIPVFLAAGIWLVWGMLGPSSSITVMVVILLVFLALLFFLQRQTRPLPLRTSKTTLLLLLALFGVCILLRLAFISKVLVPLYFDSAQHYLVIKNLIRDVLSGQTNSFPLSAGGYYHMGFHILAAFLASALQAEIADVILILGQMILATIPLSVFFLIRHATGSNGAGIFAVLLAGFGWYMPAYAVNWGKYPALASLPLITFVVSLAYLILKHGEAFSSRQWLGFAGIFLGGVAIMGLVHSRSLIVFGMAALAWIGATGWQKLPRWSRLIVLIAVLLGILAEISFIRTKDVFNPLFDPYWNRGLFVTTVVLFLWIFAQWTYPRPAFACILVIAFLLGSIFIPVSVPGYGNLTLLDRPFVEMILYLPLSLLGGLGLAGLEQRLKQFASKRETPHRWPVGSVRVLFMGAVLANALAGYNLYPADCCSIVGRDDLVAIEWMAENLPPGARILISSTELRVLATDSSQGSVGADAGTWITPLTDRVTVTLPFQSDFSQPATFELLCGMDVDYIYVGDQGAPFRAEQISLFPDRYRLLLSMPKVKVYQVIGCPQTASLVKMSV
jgi:hypothetical protein